MLEQFLIFTKGGLVLWKEIGNALKGSPIDTLIRSCLLEERAGDRLFRYDAPGASYTCKWAFNNDLGLVFVAVYQQFLNLLYVDGLLTMVKREFSAMYSPKRSHYSDFDEVYRQLLREAEARADQLKQQTRPTDTPTVVNQNNHRTNCSPQKKPQSGDGGTSSSEEGSEDADPVAEANGHHGTHNNVSTDVPKTEDTAFNVEQLKRKATKGSKKQPAGKTKTKAKAPPSKDVGKLDHTQPGQTANDVKPLANIEKSKVDEDEPVEEQPVGKTKGWFSSVFASIADKPGLEKGDLAAPLKILKDRLMTKNVAEEIAGKLCDSVESSLVGKKLGTFSRLSATVQAAMEESLLRILTPQRSIDIMRDIQAAKEEGRPYVIVFVGVNGVGKSTNLAKVAYWLSSNDVSVLLAACDTFRSGAVEQLRVHAQRLNIPLFEKGYVKDPAPVAKQAITQAKQTKRDVVLVDTAGRMQDNEPLMAALARLINLNKPDLVLFVGEALVGNEAVDQLSKFNQKLADKAAKAGTDRVIDGILLTKFDTIDDKVGAALSMVYISGAPIMFVGCGQNYPDLKKLNVKSIISTLLA